MVLYWISVDVCGMQGLYTLQMIRMVVFPEFKIQAHPICFKVLKPDENCNWLHFYFLNLWFLLSMAQAFLCVIHSRNRLKSLFLIFAHISLILWDWKWPLSNQIHAIDTLNKSTCLDGTKWNTRNWNNSRAWKILSQVRYNSLVWSRNVLLFKYNIHNLWIQTT